MMRSSARALTRLPCVLKRLSQSRAPFGYGGTERENRYRIGESSQIGGGSFETRGSQHPLVNFHVGNDADSDTVLRQAVEEPYCFRYVGKDDR